MDYSSFFEAKLNELRVDGSYRYFLELHRSAQHFPRFTYKDESGVLQQAVNWCSNDYLGMSTEEAVISKLSWATHRSGAGSGGTRNISGTTVWHRELELLLAGWHKKESALLFNGAYQANVTTLQTLGQHIPGLIFISDERNHASIIEGIRGCKNQKRIFRHNDMEHLEQLLKEIPPDQPKLIVFESVYSMSGTLAPIKEITSLARAHNALTYVDEVHAVGLYGPEGAGITAREGLQNEVDIINGTLSKAIGVFGGYITASAVLIDFIRSFGRGFIFTTSLPPAICAAAAQSINHIRANAALRTSFFNKLALLRQTMSDEQIPFSENSTHITIIPVGDPVKCRKLAVVLLKQHGIYLQPINFPTVPEGEECLRIIVTARHQPRQIHHLAYCLKKILHENNQADGKTVPAFPAAAAYSKTQY